MNYYRYVIIDDDKKTQMGVAKADNHHDLEETLTAEGFEVLSIIDITFNEYLDSVMEMHGEETAYEEVLSFSDEEIDAISDAVVEDIMRNSPSDYRSVVTNEMSSYLNLLDRDLTDQQINHVSDSLIWSLITGLLYQAGGPEVYIKLLYAIVNENKKPNKKLKKNMRDVAAMMTEKINIVRENLTSQESSLFENDDEDDIIL